MAKKTAWDWALTSGLSTGIGKKKGGKPEAPEFQSYSGYRPPHVGHLRPVEDQITKILMERSAGQDVGFDPKRREELLQNFNTEQGRDLEDKKSDLQNRISGMGLSRNPAVYDELLGRAEREAGREKNLYTNRVDIEDLAKRNEERDVNTGRLQGLNTFNFGQEDKAADFDLNVYNSENAARNSSYDRRAGSYQDPLGTALELAGKGAGLYADYQTGGMYSAAKNGISAMNQTPSAGAYKSPTNTYGGADQGQDAFSNYLKQLSLNQGYNLYQ